MTKYYKIRIDMQQAYLSTQNPNCFYSLSGKGKIAITKASWHNDMLVKKGKQNKYWILYEQNKVFN